MPNADVLYQIQASPLLMAGDVTCDANMTCT